MRHLVTDVINPSTGELLTSVPSLDLTATDAAIDRAQRAFVSWR